MDERSGRGIFFRDHFIFTTTPLRQSAVVGYDISDFGARPFHSKGVLGRSKSSNRTILSSAKGKQEVFRRAIGVRLTFLGR